MAWVVVAVAALAFLAGVPGKASEAQASATNCSTLIPAPLPATVCATAIATPTVTCTLARTFLGCEAVARIGGSGASPLQLPGDVRWSGQAGAEMCAHLPCSTAVSTRGLGHAAWQGLLFGASASDEQQIVLASMTINSPQPGDCISWSVSASANVIASAIVLPVQLGPLPYAVDQVTASAGDATTGSYCV